VGLVEEVILPRENTRPVDPQNSNVRKLKVNYIKSRVQKEFLGNNYFD